MINRMFGAPCGGTTLGGHHGVDSLAVSLITPPNFGSGGGSCLPLIVVVASGEPGVPLICWAHDEEVIMVNAAHMAPALRMRRVLFIFSFSILLSLFGPEV